MWADVGRRLTVRMAQSRIKYDTIGHSVTTLCFALMMLKNNLGYKEYQLSTLKPIYNGQIILSTFTCY